MKYYYKLISLRFTSLNKWIKWPAMIAVISVMIYEFCLNHIASKYQWQNDLGIFTSKLYYSFISAALFYFIVVHLPKERKKVAMALMINNKLSNNLILLTAMFTTLHNMMNDGNAVNAEVKNDANYFRELLALKPNLSNQAILIVKENLTKIYIDTSNILTLHDFLDSSILKAVAILHSDAGVVVNLQDINIMNNDLICSVLAEVHTNINPMIEASRKNRPYLDLFELQQERIKS